jgi:hypothetical protein
MEDQAERFNDELIIKRIYDQKCILILGPDIVFNFEKSLLNELSSHLNKNGIEHKFDAYDELFSSNIDNDPLFFDELSTFFDNLTAAPIYQKIAEIPFHLIISLSPDLILKQVFEYNKLDYSFDYYNKILNPKPIENPEKQKPLIYNILGSYKEYDSLVLCFRNVFDYLAAILGNKQLNSDLKYAINSAQSILFLGFKFDKWYFKMILQVLNLGEKAIKQASLKEIERIGDKEVKQNMVVDFYKNEFKLQFIKQDENEVIDLLYNRFLNKNELRKPRKEKIAEKKVTNIINITGNKNIVVQDADGELSINK